MHTPNGGGWGPPGPHQGAGGFGAPSAPHNIYAPPVIGGEHGGPVQVIQSAQTWLILGVVSAALGCVPLGGIGAWQAHEAKNLAEAGMLDAARSKLGTAKVLVVLGLASCVVTVLLLIGIGVAGVIVEGMGR